MSELFITSVTHVLPMTTIRRQRLLPVPGSITVRVNEKVQATDVVAQAEVDARHFFLDISRGLGVSVSEAPRYIRCQIGERVEAGDVIAGPIGVTRRTVRAPAEGRVAVIQDGKVLLEARGELFQLKAGFPGVVIGTDGSQSVTIETTGALVQGVWGNGLQEYGVMRVIGEGPDAGLHTNQLDVNLRGAVLVAGMCDHSAPLHQATELSVRGVILGSMPSDLIPVTRRLPYPVLLTEGFGQRPMNSLAFGIFTSNLGREVAVDASGGQPQLGQRPEAVIPLPASRAVSLPDEVIPIKRGVRVRILKPPHAGQVGIVKQLLKSIVSYPSGIRSRSVEVEVEELGSVNVPIENVEILQ
jgi:hypothetical protein